MSVWVSIVVDGGLQFDERLQRILKSRPCLRITPVVEQGDVLHALNRAAWRTGFEGIVFMIKVLRGVILQRDGRITPLLRAVMDQPVFANIEVTASGATSPVA